MESLLPTRTLAALVVGGPLLLLAAPKATPPPARAEKAGTDLHPAVRAVIDTKMEAHAQDMTDLMLLVILLERKDAAETAERIAAEPRIARPLDGAGDANAGVPAPFFRLQDELGARAKAVAAAARSGDDTAMTTAFGAMMGTCVECHSRYLDPRP